VCSVTGNRRSKILAISISVGNGLWNKEKSVECGTLAAWQRCSENFFPFKYQTKKNNETQQKPGKTQYYQLGRHKNQKKLGKRFKTR